MALFGKKSTEATEEVAVATPKAKAAEMPTLARDIISVITKPRITEKAALLIDRRVYTFEVRKGTTKDEVRDAIKALYKVTPVRVRIVNQAPRQTMNRARGRKAVVHGLRKAYVYLKEGDRIDLV